MPSLYLIYGWNKTILSLWGSLNKISLLLSHTLGFLYTHIVTKGCPLYTYSIGRTRLYFYFEEIWRKPLFFLCHTLGFLNTHIITKGCPFYTYSIGRKKIYFNFHEIWRKSLDFLSHTLDLLYTYIVSKGRPLYIYSMGRTKIYSLSGNLKCLFLLNNTYSYLQDW